MPAKKQIPVSQLKNTDHLNVHEDITRKYGIRANHAIKENLSLNESISIPEVSSEKSNLI
jgi:hypothetical protein